MFCQTSPVDLLPVLVGAGQLLIERLLELGGFLLVAEQILAIIGDVGVGELREAVVVRTLLRPLARFLDLVGRDVRIGRVGRDQDRVQVLHDLGQLRVVLHVIGQVLVVPALDERPQPLAVGDDHLVFLLAGRQRGGDAFVERRPRDEVHRQRDLLAARRLEGAVELLLHEPGRRPVGHGHVDGDVLSPDGAGPQDRCRAPTPPGRHRSAAFEQS